MCHISAGKPAFAMNTPCDCDCGCPVLLPIDDVIRKLEDHKKIRQDQIEAIDKKIAALKSVKDS
jgi:L-lactate utilization protein LutB